MFSKEESHATVLKLLKTSALTKTNKIMLSRSSVPAQTLVRADKTCFSVWLKTLVESLGRDMSAFKKLSQAMPRGQQEVASEMVLSLWTEEPRTVFRLA